MWKKINEKVGTVGTIASAIVAITVIGGVIFKIDQRYSKAAENGRRYAEFKQHEATATINQIDLSLDTYRKLCGPEFDNCPTERDDKRVRELFKQREDAEKERQEYRQRRKK